MEYITFIYYITFIEHIYLQLIVIDDINLFITLIQITSTPDWPPPVPDKPYLTAKQASKPYTEVLTHLYQALEGDRANSTDL